MRPMLIAPIMSALILMLAGCGGGGPSVSAQNASVNEVAEKVAAATTDKDAPLVQPGRWEGTMTIHEMDMPGIPPQAKEKLQARMGQGRTFISCITPEEAKAKKAFFTGDAADKSCKYDHFEMGGGKIDAAMQCTRETGKMSMVMNGSYAPEEYHMAMTSKAEGAGPMAGMSMKMSVEAKRVGECKGTPDES